MCQCRLLEKTFWPKHLIEPAAYKLLRSGEEVPKQGMEVVAVTRQEEGRVAVTTREMAPVKAEAHHHQCLVAVPVEEDGRWWGCACMRPADDPKEATDPSERAVEAVGDLFSYERSQAVETQQEIEQV